MNIIYEVTMWCQVVVYVVPRSAHKRAGRRIGLVMQRISEVRSQWRGNPRCSRPEVKRSPCFYFSTSFLLLSFVSIHQLSVGFLLIPSAMFRSIRRLPRRAPVVSTVSSRSLRPFTSGYTRMTTPVQHPVSTTLPSDAYQLLSTQEKAGESEDALYDQQLRDVESWWNSPRYEGIKRPYTAADVVSKRGSLTTNVPSSLMARKLF
jgi:Isocitrate lyase